MILLIQLSLNCFVLVGKLKITSISRVYIIFYIPLKCINNLKMFQTDLKS